MRVVQGMSQSLCIGFAGVDLRRALSAKRTEFGILFWFKEQP
jgi:hypothetical protein